MSLSNDASPFATLSTSARAAWPVREKGYYISWEFEMSANVISSFRTVWAKTMEDYTGEIHSLSDCGINVKRVVITIEFEIENQLRLQRGKRREKNIPGKSVEDSLFVGSLFWEDVIGSTRRRFRCLNRFRFSDRFGESCRFKLSKAATIFFCLSISNLPL